MGSSFTAAALGTAAHSVLIARADAIPVVPAVSAAGNGDDEEAGGKASAAGDSGDEDGEDAQASTGPRVLGLSKKTSEQRRAELLGQGANSLGGVLAAVVADQAGALLRSPHGCDVVVEVARGGDAGEACSTQALFGCDPRGMATRLALGAACCTVSGIRFHILAWPSHWSCA